jgi:hypothetical protein
VPAQTCCRSYSISQTTSLAEHGESPSFTNSNVSAALCSSYFENRPPPKTARSIAPTWSHVLIVSRSAPIVSATSVALNKLVLWRESPVGWIGCTMASFGVRGDSTNKIGPWINMRQQANCDGEMSALPPKRTRAVQRRRAFLKVGYQACVDQHAIEAARFGPIGAAVK